MLTLPPRLAFSWPSDGLCGEVQLRLCLVCILVCADVYLQASVSRSSIGCYIYAAILLPTSSVCSPRLPAWWRCFNARLLLSTQHGRPRATTLTQAKAIAPIRAVANAPTGHCLLPVCLLPACIAYRAIPLPICSTCQHMPASLSTPYPMPSPQPNAQSDPPASLRGCSKCTDGGVAEMAGRTKRNEPCQLDHPSR